MDLITSNAVISYPIIISALSEIVKRLDILNSKYIPVVAILFGLVIAWYTNTNYLEGLVAGLTAVGLYRTVKDSGGDAVSRIR